MKSQWEVTYVGSHTSVFIKKLERFLNVKTTEALKERYEKDGKSYERTIFEIEHPVSEWQELLIDAFRMAGLISKEWKIYILEVNSHVGGSINVDEREEKGGFLIEGPTVIKNISWEIKLDQNYTIERLSGESKF